MATGESARVSASDTTGTLSPRVSTIDWRLEYYLQWQHVKNLIPHQSIYNWGRMQEVWMDK